MKNCNVIVTELEKTVLESLISQLYAEPGFSDVDAKDIANDTGIETRIIRGVLSSLVKKGIVQLEATNTYGANEQFVIIYLKKEYWGLHPEWSAEAGFQQALQQN
jgi:transcription initiation factor IIE alpha subunit